MFRSVSRVINPTRQSICSFHKTARVQFPMTASNTNKQLQKVQYAVRGEIVLRAGEYERQLKV